MKSIKTDKPNYFGILPASVRYDKSLCMGARVLFSELTALTNKEGYCWASNEYFATLYDVSNATVSSWINELKEKGHVTITLEKGYLRKVYLQLEPFNNSFRGVQENLNPPSKKLEHNNTSNITKTKDIYLDDSDAYKLASYLFKKILERNPTHKRPNMQKWAKEIDVLLTTEKRDKHEVAEVIAWCQSDSFWQNNILSTSKLREKYDQLNIKRKTPCQPKGSQLGTIDKAKYERLLNNPPTSN